jgi:putative Ca2+/H+ antiporter (TMEM165/GDT1 family)
MGDKTMLATITIASERKDFYGVWIGSTVGMVWRTAWRSSSAGFGQNIAGNFKSNTSAPPFPDFGFLDLWEALR